MAGARHSMADLMDEEKMEMVVVIGNDMHRNRFLSLIGLAVNRQVHDLAHGPLGALIPKGEKCAADVSEGIMKPIRHPFTPLSPGCNLSKFSARAQRVSSQWVFSIFWARAFSRLFTSLTV
jgi:hypothetical protein